MSPSSAENNIPTEISDFQSLCTVIGFVEVNWALFEQSLDCIVLTVYRELGASAIEKKLPKTYKSKSNFLKKAFSKVVVLNSLKTEANTLLEKSDALATRRKNNRGQTTNIKIQYERIGGRPRLLPTFEVGNVICPLFYATHKLHESRGSAPSSRKGARQSQNKAATTVSWHHKGNRIS